MKKLFEIELLKLRYSKSTKVVFIIYAAFTLLGLLAFQGALTAADNSPITDAGEYSGFPAFNFPMVWYMVSWASTILIIFPAILAILHVANEFSSKIHRQHVIDGLSKQEYVLSKFISVIIISAAFTIYTGLLAIIVALMAGSSSYPEELKSEAIKFFFGSTPPIMWLLGYFLYAVSILSFGTFISFLFRRTGRAIFFFLAYCGVLEWLMIWFFRKSEAVIDLLPVWSVANNIFPNVRKIYKKTQDVAPEEVSRSLLEFDTTASFIAIIYIVIYFALSRWIFLKRDL